MVVTIVSDVILTSALRGNLLSLQGTQRLIDDVQLRLATGLDINSALDGPQEFFTAQRLSNRASDLAQLLDGISQSIRTIEEASIGVTALTDIVEQAQALAQAAEDELAAAESTARAVGNVDLSTIADLTTLTGIANSDQFQILTTNDAGTQISETIVINTGDTIYTLAAKITNQFADNQNGEIISEITEDGFISIASTNGRTFRAIDGTVGSGNEVGDAGFDSLGLGEYFEIEFTTPGGAFATRSAATVVAGRTITSISLYDASGDIAEAGDTLANRTFFDTDGNALISGLTIGGAILTRVYSGGTATFANVAIGANTTFQSVVDAINNNTAVNHLFRADFDSSTGQLSFTSLDDSLETLEVGVFGFGNIGFDIGLGDPTGNIDPIVPDGGAFTLDSRAYSFNTSNDVLDRLADDYDVLLQQIDELVVDAQYQGVNLLGGDDLTTFFNEDRTNSLLTSGVNFSASGLGLTETNFRNTSEVELTKAQVRDALETVRSFGSSLSNNLAIIQTRRTFTEETINSLLAGSDDLTVADQNQLGANLLALQTRQALGVTSLSLASQSQQSVLRLF